MNNRQTGEPYLLPPNSPNSVGYNIPPAWVQLLKTITHSSINQPEIIFPAQEAYPQSTTSPVVGNDYNNCKIGEPYSAMQNSHSPHFMSNCDPLAWIQFLKSVDIT